MVFFLEKKWPRLILAACLAFATLGVFTFAELEPLRSVHFQEDNPVSGGFFIPVDFSLDCLAEGETIISKARGYSFSPVRNGALRVLTFPGIQNTGSVPAESPLSKNERTTYLYIKNTIPLKFRT
jgi:hypothetical protein